MLCAPFLFFEQGTFFKAGIEPATRGFPGPLLYQLSYKVLCCACLYNSVRRQAGVQYSGVSAPTEYFKMHRVSQTSGKAKELYPAFVKSFLFAVCIFKTEDESRRQRNPLCPFGFKRLSVFSRRFFILHAEFEPAFAPVIIRSASQ